MHFSCSPWSFISTNCPRQGHISRSCQGLLYRSLRPHRWVPPNLTLYSAEEKLKPKLGRHKTAVNCQIVPPAAAAAAGTSGANLTLKLSALLKVSLGSEHFSSVFIKITTLSARQAFRWNFIGELLESRAEIYNSRSWAFSAVEHFSLCCRLVWHINPRMF